VIQATDETKGRRTDRHLEIIMIDASAKKEIEQASPPSFRCKGLDGNIYAEAGRRIFVAEPLGPRRKLLQNWVVLLLGVLGRFRAVCICKV